MDLAYIKNFADARSRLRYGWKNIFCTHIREGVYEIIFVNRTVRIIYWWTGDDIMRQLKEE